MDEFDQIEADFIEQHPGYATPAMQMQLYPLSLAQQQPYQLAQVPAAEPFLQRRLGPLPVWGWGLGLVGAGVAAYFYMNKKDVKKNSDSSDDDDDSSWKLPPGQVASRTQFCERLQPFLQKNGIASTTVVYRDADEAAKKLKQVSPLVTIQCKGKVPIKELSRFAKREGLTATEHDSGVVGFYPGSGKKGKAWEEYIDALREAGQKV